VSLKEETVDVERSRVERTLKPEEADKAFGERTVEMTATTEKPVVSKQAHVVEEVALTKQSGQREETVSGTVRRQDVKVEEIDRKSGSSRKS
jgi:stress response protein YsnF